jgi:hypothetical protein
MWRAAAAWRPPTARSAAADCPVDSTTLPLTVTVTMDSEDLCAAQVRAVTLTPTLTSHVAFDSATKVFGAEKRAFFQQQPVFFKLLLASGGFLIDSARMLEVVVATTTASGDVIVYDGTTATSGWSFDSTPVVASATISAATTQIVEFHFTPNPLVFGTVSRAAPFTSNVVVAAEVVFVNTAGARKRVVLQLDQARLNSKQVLAEGVFDVLSESDVEVDAVDPTTDKPKSDTPLIVGVVVGAVALCGAIAVLVFLLRRRRDRQQQQQ